MKDGKLKVRFLGTGAADWNGRNEFGEMRRLTSVLLDGKVLIDFTQTAWDMIPVDVSPKTIFYTHSHVDHYNTEAALRIGIRKAYAHASWADEARNEFAEASKRLGVAMPEVNGLKTGETAEADGIRFTILPANHCTKRKQEQCAMYLVEKGKTRLLYATDTSGIPGVAARIAGIDAHVPGKPITALIMEATMGVDHTDDFRLYTHSSVATVAQTVRVLKMTKRYAPTDGQKVWLTHMARTLHGPQNAVAAAVPEPLAPAYDGLEIEL